MIRVGFGMRLRVYLRPRLRVNLGSDLKLGSSWFRPGLG